MDKKGQLTSLIVGLFIVLVVGVIMLSLVWTQTSEQTAQTAVTQDTFTISNSTCTRLNPTNCFAAGSVTFNNVSQADTIGADNFTECGTNNVFFGVRLISNVTDGDLPAGIKDGATANASYTQQSCQYITSSTTRTIVNYFAIFMAIVLISVLGAAIVGLNK